MPLGHLGRVVIRGRLGSISPLAFKAFMSCLVLLRVCLIFFLGCVVLCYVLSCAVLSCPRPCLCLVLSGFCCVVFCCAPFLVSLQPAVNRQLGSISPLAFWSLPFRCCCLLFSVVRRLLHCCCLSFSVVVVCCLLLVVGGGLLLP